MLIAQLSDPHVMPAGELAFGRLDTGEMLGQAVSVEVDGSLLDPMD